MKILLLVTDYPSVNNLSANAFVHTRIVEYLKVADVKVVKIFSKGEDYTFENVHVASAATTNDIKKIHQEYCPNVVFIHFFDGRLFVFVKDLQTPVVIWVHGFEALGWYRRMFNYSMYGFLRNAHDIILSNMRQLFQFRRLIFLSNERKTIYFTFVSNWMRRITEADTLCKAINSVVVPNPINVALFKYNHKHENHRKRILILRSFNSNKYANDIAIDALMKLSKKDFFEDLSISIYGRGNYFSKLTKPLTAFANVTLNEKFVKNDEIPEIHKAFGVFLCPTRQDAQGVSMCEAMSSGLVPLTSNCTAIPEFVQHGKTGMLSNNSEELARHIEYMYHNPEHFLEMSKNASQFIKDTCSTEKIIARELQLAEEIVMSSSRNFCKGVANQSVN